MLQPKPGSQIYCHELCKMLEGVCGVETCSTRMATDLVGKAFKDADPPIIRKRIKAAGQDTRTNVYQTFV